VVGESVTIVQIIVSSVKLCLSCSERLIAVLLCGMKLSFSLMCFVFPKTVCILLYTSMLLILLEVITYFYY
jgi:hypothetical protein